MNVKKMVCLGIGFFLLLFPGIVSAQSDKKPSVEMKIEYGFQGNVKSGDSIPLAVTMKNTGDYFQGDLEISIPVEEDPVPISSELWFDNSTDILQKEQMYIYRKKVVLYPEETLQKIFYVDVPLYRNLLDVKLWKRNTNERELENSESITINFSENQSRILVGVVSNKKVNTEKLEGMSVSLEQGYSQNMFVKALVLQPEEIYPWQAALQQLDVLIIDSEVSFSKQQQLVVQSWKAQGGFCLEWKGEPVEQLFENMESGEKKQEFQNYLERRQTALFHDTSEIDLVPVNYRPSMKKFAIVLSIYILLVGPGLYIFLKRKQKQKYIWVGIISLSVVFSVIIKLLGFPTNFSAPFISYCGEYEQKDGIWNETSSIGIQAPYNNEFQVYLDSAYELQPLDMGCCGKSNKNTEHVEQILIDYQKENTKITMKNMPAFTQSYFQLRKNQFIAPEEQISLRITGNGKVLTGEWKNPTDYEIHNGILLTKNRMAVLGNLDANGTGDFEEKKLFSNGTDGMEKALEELLDFSQYYFPEYELKHMAEKAEFLQRESQLGESYFLGIIENPDVSFQCDSGYKIFGTTLFFMPIEVDWEEKGKIWIPNLEVYGTSSDQSFDVITNLMSERISIVSYNIPSDCQIESLELFPTDYYAEKYFVPFQGNVSLYNWEKDCFEVLGDWKKILRGQEIQKYISKENTMKVQYTQDDALNAMERVVMLPCIQVEGRTE